MSDGVADWKRPSLTAAARGSRVSARVGTEEWLRRGPNQNATKPEDNMT